MKDEFLSTTSVSAMLEFWKQNNVDVPHLKIPEILEVRLLSVAEKAKLSAHYDGNQSRPWYGFYIDGEMVAAHDSLKILLRRIKEAGYPVRDLGTLV